MYDFSRILHVTLICSCSFRGRCSSVGMATGYGAGRSGDWIPVEGRFSAPVQTGPGAHPVSCTMGTVSFLGVKSGRDVTLTPHPLLVPWSWKSRAIPLLPLWAVRPVQSLSACTRVIFTFTMFHMLCIVVLLLKAQHIVTKIVEDVRSLLCMDLTDFFKYNFYTV